MFYDVSATPASGYHVFCDTFATPALGKHVFCDTFANQPFALETRGSSMVSKKNAKKRVKKTRDF